MKLNKIFLINSKVNSKAFIVEVEMIECLKLYIYRLIVTIASYNNIQLGKFMKHKFVEKMNCIGGPQGLALRQHTSRQQRTVAKSRLGNKWNQVLATGL